MGLSCSRLALTGTRNSFFQRRREERVQPPEREEKGLHEGIRFSEFGQKPRPLGHNEESSVSLLGFIGEQELRSALRYAGVTAAASPSEKTASVREELCRKNAGSFSNW